MIGNITATVFVGIGVWLSSEWQPNPYEDGKQLLALVLLYSAGLLNSMSSQWSVYVGEESNYETDGKDSHDYKNTKN
jgi:hypothetical protein